MRCLVISTSLKTNLHSVNLRTGRSITLGFCGSSRSSLGIWPPPDCSTLCLEDSGNNFGKFSFWVGMPCMQLAIFFCLQDCSGLQGSRDCEGTLFK